jgi:hypothetical protein
MAKINKGLASQYIANMSKHSHTGSRSIESQLRIEISRAIQIKNKIDELRYAINELYLYLSPLEEQISNRLIDHPELMPIAKEEGYYD